MTDLPTLSLLKPGGSKKNFLKNLEIYLKTWKNESVVAHIKESLLPFVGLTRLIF